MHCPRPLEHGKSAAQRVRKAARESQIEIIPAVFPIGYAGRLLAHDPNLAEGVPAVDIPFVVRGQEAVLVPERSARIVNGDLERTEDHLFTGFMLQDDPGKTTFADHAVVHGGRTSFRIQDTGKGNANSHYRLAQRVRVRIKRNASTTFSSPIRSSCSTTRSGWPAVSQLSDAKCFSGRLLADNVARGIRILKQTNPAAKIVVWSDMFDPNHNAMDHYDLVRGSLAGSWKGLTSDVIIANWNVDRAAESLKWFGALGHRQIIGGYYDSSLDNYKKWDVAARGVPRVEGFIYTTWEGKYDSLEEYGKALLPKSAKIP